MDISNITLNRRNSIRIDTGKIIYIDPFRVPNPRNDADYIFITHKHYDHLSLKDIKALINDNTTIVVPKKAENTIKMLFGNVPLVSVVPNEHYEIDDISFDTVPSYNIIKPQHPKRMGWCGYILNIDGMRIYIGGDMDLIPEAEAVKCDVAVVPVGGTYTMNYKAAAKLINTIRPKYAFPCHYEGSFILGGKNAGNKFKSLVEKEIEVIVPNPFPV